MPSRRPGADRGRNATCPATSSSSPISRRAWRLSTAGYTQRTWVDEAVAVRCALAPGLPVTKVFLFYREPVKQRFTEVEMKRTPKGWFKGRIPERVVYGQSLQFYFEDGTPPASRSSGTASRRAPT